MASENLDTIVLGGGCFWCTESVLQGLRGVQRVTPGYCGGHVEKPQYAQVCRGDTGHVEAVQVVFDPALLPLEQLLRVFFATHDPTTVDRQGGDIGPQYASTIFPASPAQSETARKVMAEVEQALGKPVVTQLRPAAPFWPAEAGHRDYYRRNPNQAYCRIIIAPKLAKLREGFAPLLS